MVSSSSSMLIIHRDEPNYQNKDSSSLPRIFCRCQGAHSTFCAKHSPWNEEQSDHGQDIEGYVDDVVAVPDEADDP